MKPLTSILAAFAFATVITAVAQTASTASSPNVAISEPPRSFAETFRISSRALHEQRELHIYLPPSYGNSKQRYPVIYTLDGEVTGLATANAVQFMTSYSSIPQIPEAIVVAVINQDRNRDMPRPQDFAKGGQETFLRFLAEELIPGIEQKYRTQPLRILLGHSQGGLFATFALTARPTIFQWYLAIDAPLYGFPDVKPLMEKFKTVTQASNRGRFITVENLYGWKREWPLLATSPKGFYGVQVEIIDETHETMFYKSDYEGLKRLFNDYTPNFITHNRGVQSLAQLEARYKTLSTEYGYQVEIPRQVLLEAASQSTAMQFGEDAVKLIGRAVEIYGETPTTKRLFAEAQEAVKKGLDPRQIEWASLPPPDVERMKPFLGTWERVGKDGARWFMTFAVKDGVVSSQNAITTPTGDSAKLEVQFVKVVDAQTLQWGLLNGLGGGTILHTGKLVDKNTLEGMIEPVGIQQAPPPQPFTYKRRLP